MEGSESPRTDGSPRTAPTEVPASAGYPDPSLGAQSIVSVQAATVASIAGLIRRARSIAGSRSSAASSVTTHGPASVKPAFVVKPSGAGRLGSIIERDAGEQPRVPAASGANRPLPQAGYAASAVQEQRLGSRGQSGGSDTDIARLLREGEQVAAVIDAGARFDGADRDADADVPPSAAGTPSAGLLSTQHSIAWSHDTASAGREQGSRAQPHSRHMARLDIHGRTASPRANDDAPPQPPSVSPRTATGGPNTGRGIHGVVTVRVAVSCHPALTAAGATIDAKVDRESGALVGLVLEQDPDAHGSSEGQGATRDQNAHRAIAQRMRQYQEDAQRAWVCL